MSGTTLGAGNRAVDTTLDFHTLVGEKRRNTRKQVEFQMVRKPYAGKALQDVTECKGREAVLNRGQERSLRGGDI